MSVTCYFSGRLGNNFYNIAMMIAYCKKHNLQYYVPTESWAYGHFGKPQVNPLPVPSTGPQPVNPTRYQEPAMATAPYYHEIPAMDNVLFDGYYQSFKYVNDYRQDILDTFNFPHETEKGIVSISVRRGDNVTEDRGAPVQQAFPIAPVIYYHRAIEYMQKKGYNTFRLYSDDIPWCKEEFTTDNYPGATFQFSEGKSELEDYISLTQCEHNITARSTFSLTAAWMNQNPNKIVLVPQENMWWKGQNRNLLTDSDFTQIYFPQEYNIHMMKYWYTYQNIRFALIIQNYWKDIYRGQPEEPLYPDYCKMLDRVQMMDKSRYVLDIGVNHGIFAVPCSMLGYKVLGFEPVEVNYSSVQLAAIENKLTDFDIFRYAVSDTDGEIEIYVPECSDNTSLSKDAAISNMVRKDYTIETVKTINFDNWINNNLKYWDIGFIKLDVQGAEYAVVTGMKRYLANAHDVTIICEYEHHLVTMGHTFEQMDSLFQSLGFEFKGYLTPNDKIFYKP
jgi:FkbM family methyltransferase